MEKSDIIIKVDGISTRESKFGLRVCALASDFDIAGWHIITIDQYLKAYFWIGPCQQNITNKAGLFPRKS